MQVMARGQNEVQSRSFSDYVDGGYEFVLGLDLSSKVETLGRGCDLLKAPQCPGGVTDLIQGGEMVALQIHESCDTRLKLTGSLAKDIRRNIVPDTRKRQLQYGSPAVHLVADATCPGGLGDFRVR